MTLKQWAANCWLKKAPRVAKESTLPVTSILLKWYEARQVNQYYRSIYSMARPMPVERISRLMGRKRYDDVAAFFSKV